MATYRRIFMLFCLVTTLTTMMEAQPTLHPMEDLRLIESTEIAAWRDLIDAAPPLFRQAHGLRHEDIGGGMAINFQIEPTPLFNRVIGLGISEPLTQETIDRIKIFYEHGEKYIVHYIPGMQPLRSDSLLRKNGFYLAGSWGRVVRDVGRWNMMYTLTLLLFN
jgi:hypothetical protein